MNLRTFINRLEELSHNGENDNLEVVFRTGTFWGFYPEITTAHISQDPNYDFDESNCGPDRWVELNISDEDRNIFASGFDYE